MTLILTALTREYVVQVSDRRLTDARTGDVYEDEANKALMFCGHSTWALTGLAVVGGRRVDELFMETIVDSGSVTNALDEASRVFTERLRAFAPPGMTGPQRRAARRLALVGGAIVRDAEGHLRPCCFVLSNFFDGNGGWLPEADIGFGWWARTLSDVAPVAVFASGTPLPPTVMAEIQRAVRRAHSHGTGPKAIARLLAAQIRVVAERRPSVGRSLMVTILRKRHLLPGNPNISSEPMALDPLAPEIERFREPRAPAGWSWMYLAGNPSEVVHHGPLVACAGVQIRGMLFGPTEELQARGLI